MQGDVAIAAKGSSARSASVVGPSVGTVGPEVPLGVPAPAAIPGAHPSVAYTSPAHTLVVWEDARENERDRTIRAARVDDAGTVLDPNGVRLDGGGDNRRPAVAFDGTNYLVVWGMTDATHPTRIVGTRVSQAGVVLDVPPVDISPVGGTAQRPSVGFDGVRYLVAWDNRTATSGSGDILGAQVETDGTLTAPGTPFTISAANGTQTSPRIAILSGLAFVVWIDGRGVSPAVFGARVAGGVVQDASGVLVDAGPDVAVSVTAWEGAFLCAFSQTAQAAETVGLVRVSAAGAVLDAPPVVVTSSAVAGSLPVVASDGTNGDVVWQDSGNPGLDVVGAWIAGSAGAPNPTSVRTVDGDVRDQKDLQAWGGAAGIAATFSTGLAGMSSAESFIGLQRWPATAWPVTSSPIEVSQSASTQRRPAVATDGSNFLVVWQELLGTAEVVFGNRFDAVGNPIDATPFRIAGGAGTGPASAPAVAFDGTDYVVAWRDERGADEVWAARVTAGGVVRDPTGFAVLTAAGPKSSVAIGCAGGGCVVAADLRTTPSALRVARVSGGASADLAGLPIANARPAAGERVAVGCLANPICLVAWADDRGADSNVWAARVGTAGVIDPNGFVVEAAGSDQTSPAVGTGPGAFGVVWTGESGARTHLHVVKVDAAGTIQTVPSLQVTSGSSSEDRGALAWDGQEGLFVWDTLAATDDLYGGRLNVAGTLLDGAGIPLATQPLYESWPAIAFLPSGGLGLLAYQRYDSAPAVQSQRVYARAVAITPVGGVCASNLDCPPGLPCEDGVCCNIPCGGSNPADCLACSVAAGAAKNGFCEVLGTGHTCRAAAGACDAPEVCDGIATACPADAVLPAATSCRPVAGPCDAEERCDGASPACPADAFLPATAECRAASGGCDVAEHCSGSAAACPPDAVVASGTECRASTGPCDPAESCDGATKVCPPDVLAPASQVCRPVAGACDVEERCTGTSGPCPPDAVIAAGTSCRQQMCANAETTAAASCDGTAPLCPAPVVTSCFPYGCDGDHCGSGCQLDGDCGPGARCEAPTCIPDSPNGSACTANRECLTGHCSSGVCCESACDGSCESCGAPGGAGKCQPRPGGTHGSPACPGPLVCTGTSGTCGCRGDGDCPSGQTCLAGQCRGTARDPGVGQGCHCGNGAGAALPFLSLLGLVRRRRRRE